MCETCSDGKYVDSATNLCVSCNTNCKTCEAGSVNNVCSSCTLPKYF